MEKIHCKHCMQSVSLWRVIRNGDALTDYSCPDHLSKTMLSMMDDEHRSFKVIYFKNPNDSRS